MKICMECRYIKPATYQETKYHECAHPECRHPVSGKYQTCVEMRKKTGQCKPIGQHHADK